MKKNVSVGRIRKIEDRILLVRGEKVIIDHDLADFYGVTTKRLREQIRRNIDRFPHDFLFTLSKQEKAEIVLACEHLSSLKTSRTLPYVLTEHGAIMAATVLNSKLAVEMSIFIVRAFVQLRELLGSQKELARKVGLLEKKIAHHDTQIMNLVGAIKQLISGDPLPKKRQIGFKTSEKK